MDGPVVEWGSGECSDGIWSGCETKMDNVKSLCKAVFGSS